MALESYYLKVVRQTCASTGRCGYRWTLFRWADRAGSSQWELQLGDLESIIHSSQKIEKAASSVLLELYL